jgi:hypothetical protein
MRGEIDMKRRDFPFGSLLAIAAAGVLLGSLLPGPARANEGDLVTVIQPVVTYSYTSVAVNSAGEIYVGVRDRLYKITKTGAISSQVAIVDQSGNPAYVGELSWDCDRNQLWMVRQFQQGVYLLDPVTGVATLQFTAFTTNDSGIEYDPSDGTLWFTNNTDGLIHHVTTSGSPLASLNIGPPSTGVCLGPVNALYVWSLNEILKIDKASGSILSTLATGLPHGYGLSCDSINFAPLDVLWLAKYNASTSELDAFELVSGECPCMAGTVPVAPSTWGSVKASFR